MGHVYSGVALGTPHYQHTQDLIDACGPGGLLPDGSSIHDYHDLAEMNGLAPWKGPGIRSFYESKQRWYGVVLWRDDECDPRRGAIAINDIANVAHKLTRPAADPEHKLFTREQVNEARKLWDAWRKVLSDNGHPDPGQPKIFLFWEWD